MNPEEPTSPGFNPPFNQPNLLSPATESTHLIDHSTTTSPIQESEPTWDDRDRIAADLRAAEARWRAILKNSPNVVANLDRTGKILFINRAMREDLSAEQAVGMSIYDLILPDYHELQRSLLKRVLATAEVIRYEVATSGLGTTPIYYQGQIGPLKEGEQVISAIVVLNDITDQRRAELGMQQAIELEQQTREREQLIATIAQNIRQSLNLGQILTTTVQEVRRFLNVERVVIYRFNAGWNGTVITESVVNKSLSILNRSIYDPCFGNAMVHPYRQGRIHAINDISTAEINPCYQALLESLQIRAVLVLPILVHGDLWGLLIAHECSTPHHWQQISWYLLRQLSTQLAIGIQQAELYQRVQQLNAELESQVHERTLKLERSLAFEALLKRITDNVRDSLDERQILLTVVNELTTGLEIAGCDVALYDAEHQFLSISYESLSDEIPPAQGRRVAIKNLDETYLQLTAPIVRQFCCLLPPTLRPVDQRFAILHCPIAENQNSLGNLWLFRYRGAVFDESEIRLVEQVATQCAIAIRQARLYQEAQARVTDLERLNQLKDDFLSTVSHELRTPVSNIKMAAQMVEVNLSQMGLLNPDGTTPLNRYFRILQDECQREIGLINNLLDLTRLDSDTEPPLTTTIELKPWLTHVIEPFTYLLQNQQQHLELEIAADLPSLTTDLSYLQRILAELLTNASKYTPAGERIIVAASLETVGGILAGNHSDPTPPADSAIQPCLLLRITNTGVEIPSQELTRIFDKFYRIPSHDPWKHGGTGLGLALVRKLSERIGASIWVESSAGQVTFTLQLPLSGEKG